MPHGWLALTLPCALFACFLCTATSSWARAPQKSPAPTPDSATQAPVSLADQPPTAATVTYNNGQLLVHAQNSTLLQILQAVTAQTGMQVQGSPGDHRIFGIYGPGRPRQVLSDLLAGFSFNYLLIGARTNGVPQKLVLTGTATSMRAPAQPVHTVEPAPRTVPPPPQFTPRRYNPYPGRGAFPRGSEPRRSDTPARPQKPAAMPHSVPTAQQILKQLEAMHAQQQNSSH